MSELLRRAAELNKADTLNTARAQALKMQAEAQRQQQVQESRARAMEFAGHLAAHGIRPLPIYAMQYKRVPDANTRSGWGSVPDKAVRLGEGWLSRQGYYNYEESNVPSLVVTHQGDLYECLDDIRTPQTNTQLPVDEPEFFQVGRMWYEGEDNGNAAEHTVFSGEKGLNILARGLLLHEI